MFYCAFQPCALGSSHSLSLYGIAIPNVLRFEYYNLRCHYGKKRENDAKDK
jgi:hypothetical protein